MVESEQYAVKIINKGYLLKSQEKVYDLFRNEVALMKKLSNNPNVVKLHDFFETENLSFVVMEYCDGGDLESYETKNRPLSEDVVIDMMK